MVAAASRASARFSLTARASPAISTAIASIDPAAWTAIHYPNAVFDQDEQRLISAAEIAEVPFTAFTSRRKCDHVTARLIVRRVKRLNPTSTTIKTSADDGEQGELFTLYRYQLSRPAARCRSCRRTVSPGRSPNPPCGSLRNGLSTVSAIRVGWAGARGWGSCCRGTGNASPPPRRG